MFEPVGLGPRRLRNRLVKAATFEGRTPAALVSDDLVDFHRAIAAGGVAMTTLAYVAVAPEGRTHREQIFLREAALPVFEADRHAKVELKKQVRGVRPIERAVEGHDDVEAKVVQGYCAAVRSAITDDGRAPLAASGLKLRARLEKVAASLDRAAKGGTARRDSLSG